MDSLEIKNAPNLIVYRLNNDYDKEDFRSEKFRDSPIIVLDFSDERDVMGPPYSTHRLVWCNNDAKKNKDYSWSWGCSFCSSRLDDTTGYYLLCDEVGQRYPIAFHRECIQPITYNLYHSKHSLQVLIFRYYNPNTVCYCCYRHKEYNYYCSICNFCICADCERKPPLLIIEYKKKDDSILLYYLNKEASMTCDVCALDERRYFLYLSLFGDFVVHKECIYSPRVINISRHEHRLSFASSFPSGIRLCGVYDKKVDENYGGYSCLKGCYYVFHSRCALYKDVWDGKELEEEPEEIYEENSPFKELGGGIIQHFSHKHKLRNHKEIEKIVEDKRLCQACALPLYDGDIFSCMECEFFLHKVCANLPLKKKACNASASPILARGTFVQLFSLQP